MRPFSANEIRGTYATLLLPLRDDDSIEYEELEKQIASYLAAAVDGIYSNGTAGEFYSLTKEEFFRTSRLLADACERAGTPFQIGAPWPTPQEALERIAWAAEFAPSAIQVVLPDWWPPNVEESVCFLQRAADVACTISLVLYNPPHAKRVLAPNDLSTVFAKVPALVGLKTAAGDAQWYQAMQPLLRDISVFVPGHTLATGISHGAAGSYSNVACLSPRGAVQWNHLMHIDPARAMRMEDAIQRFMTSSILPFREHHGASNIALDKLLAWIGDWSEIHTRLRWPYRGIDPRTAHGLRERARQELPFLFESADVAVK